MQQLEQNLVCDITVITFSLSSSVATHCTEKFQSIHFVGFSSEAIAKQWEAMQSRFDQSFAIKHTQSFHWSHLIHPTQIRMKGLGLNDYSHGCANFS